MPFWTGAVRIRINWLTMKRHTTPLVNRAMEEVR